MVEVTARCRRLVARSPLVSGPTTATSTTSGAMNTFFHKSDPLAGNSVEGSSYDKSPFILNSCPNLSEHKVISGDFRSEVSLAPSDSKHPGPQEGCIPREACMAFPHRHAVARGVEPRPRQRAPGEQINRAWFVLGICGSHNRKLATRSFQPHGFPPLFVCRYSNLVAQPNAMRRCLDTGKIVLSHPSWGAHSRCPASPTRLACAETTSQLLQCY